MEWGSAVRLATLVTLGATLIALSLSGRLAYYVNETQTWLIALAGVGLLGLVALAARAGATSHRHDDGPPPDGPSCCAVGVPTGSPAGPVALVAMALPVVLAILPARPLGASAALNLGQDGPLPVRAAEVGRAQLAFDTAHWTLLDWHRAWAGDPELRGLVGKRVSVTGFVLPARAATDGGDPSASLQVARILITHCTADGQVLTLPIRAADEGWRADEWVQVHGTLAAAGQGAGARPVVVAEQIDRIEQPSRPYLSP